MTANVHCTGGGSWIKERPALGRWRVRRVSPEFYGKDTGPCGWKGERKTRVYAPVTFTFHGGGKHVEDRWLTVDPTAKPCPRCGGQVELIPQDGES